jgi:hypothetical protein
VRLSALTESRILRTASFELDIGFLREVYFLENRWPKACSIPQRHRVPTVDGIWYARNDVVKPSQPQEMPKTRST